MLAVLVALAGLAGGATIVFGGFIFVLHCSSGDGGEPYVARDSAQADVCGATGDGLLVVVIAIVALIALLVAAYTAGRAWVAGEASPLRIGALVLIAAISPIALITLANSPSDECGAEDLAAYEAWLDEGSRGDPPADCASY